MTDTVTTGRSSYYGDNTDNFFWTITDERGIAAELYVESAHRMIMSVEVREDRRGERLARRLYDLAAEQFMIFHVPSWGRTPEGDIFARAMGGNVMDDQTAAAITGFDLSILDNNWEKK